MNEDLNSGWFPAAWGVLGDCFVFPDMSRLLRFSRAETSATGLTVQVSVEPSKPAPRGSIPTHHHWIRYHWALLLLCSGSFHCAAGCVLCWRPRGAEKALHRPRWWLFTSAVPPHGSFGSLSSPRTAGWWKNLPCDPRVGALSHISVEEEVKTRPDGSFETWTQTPEANQRVAVVTSAPISVITDEGYIISALPVPNKSMRNFSVSLGNATTSGRVRYCRGASAA